MRRVTFFLAAGVLTAPTAVVAASWVEIGADSEGSVWSADADSARVSGRYHYVWILEDHSADTTVKYRSSKAQFKVDCSSQTYQVLSIIRYSASGRVVDSITGTDYISGIGMDPIPPETMAEAVAKFACG
jgi:hypothetical protein